MLRKISHIDSSMQLIAANSGDFRSYTNLMFEVVWTKIDEIIDSINEIIDSINDLERQLNQQ